VRINLILSMLGHSQVVPIDRLAVRTYVVPTDFPESDGTLEWVRTTLALVRVSGGGKQGIGYTYADLATATLIDKTLSGIVKGMDAMSPTAVYTAMWRRIRNLGRPGICSMAISAIDCAIWDLKARLLNLPLVTLLGQVRDTAPIYGSGGFTSYSDRQLTNQLFGWVKHGIKRVKIKIGRNAIRDVERVRVARKTISPETELYVDANGAYGRNQALIQAERFAPFGVT
jgi:L-alanine-DL-glutamate epimerase-like enolase superfamily enzyme